LLRPPDRRLDEVLHAAYLIDICLRVDRGEAINAMNHVMFVNPNTNPASSAFGTVSDALARRARDAGQSLAVSFPLEGERLTFEDWDKYATQVGKG